MPAADVTRTIDAVWRIESARLIAGLARFMRDVGLAEDLAQEALVAALEQWPEAGVPDNPGAWLMATAKHRAIDVLRRGTTLERKQQELARELELSLRSEAPRLEPDDVADGIVDRRVEVRPRRLLHLELASQLLLLALEPCAPAQHVDRAMLRGGHQPGARLVRDA